MRARERRALYRLVVIYFSHTRPPLDSRYGTLYRVLYCYRAKYKTVEVRYETTFSRGKRTSIGVVVVN